MAPPSCWAVRCRCCCRPRCMRPMGRSCSPTSPSPRAGPWGRGGTCGCCARTASACPWTSPWAIPRTAGAWPWPLCATCRSCARWRPACTTTPRTTRSPACSTAGSSGCSWSRRSRRRRRKWVRARARAPGPRPLRCCCSTLTTSRPSTTDMATTWATRCSRKWRAACRPRWALRPRWRAWAVTNSPPCCIPATGRTCAGASTRCWASCAGPAPSATTR